MVQKYKLVVGARIEFDVKFSLNDDGTDRTFGVRIRALRIDAQTITSIMKAGDKTIGDFLKDHAQAQMVAWIGEPALKPLEDGAPPVPAGAEALESLYALVPGMAGTVYHRYEEANGAKGK
jgi:hypothetical protein